ncbi:MAG: helix-turn-helix domain-containing protein [Prevotella sp.]|jgi:AraC-like DNA-binding protein|nr:helix-turn-helix domain-containing protein [Prevotella sp.]
MDKKDIGLWLFSLNDPELYQFYLEQMNNKSLYYALYIETHTQEIPPVTKEVLHIRGKTILLIETYLFPIFYRLYLKGYAVIISETFCVSIKIKTLLDLLFFHLKPEGIIDLGRISLQQRKCMYAFYKEYYSTYDDLQVSILRNLLVNIALLSPVLDSEKKFKLGHLLSNAIRFAALINNYAFDEKKKSFYANKMNITEKTLDQSLRYIYHTTFKKILINHIIIEAMRLLVFSDKTITRIAHEMGYDVSNFIKIFSQIKGMHPRILREIYRKIITDINNGYEHTPI